jgi:ubiquinone/menaquinone biosynthesis C-methylase UbiE
MDISPAAFSSMPSSLRSFCFVGSLKAIPLIDKAFDAAICIDVLEHIREEDLPEVIKECSRIAQRQVYFGVTCLEDVLFIFSDPTHISKFFSWRWHKILRSLLGDGWRVKRTPFLPLIHHGEFLAQRKK